MSEGKKLNIFTDIELDDERLVLRVEDQSVVFPCKIQKLDTLGLDIEVDMHAFINAVTSVTKGKLFE